MNRSHTGLMTAAALVLALTNGVVLVGVAFNRQQPPDSILDLTGREIGPQWSGMWRDGENSGVNLRLQYRDGLKFDRDRLSSLGFDVAPAPASNYEDTHYKSMLERDVLLVLELDGPARARALQAARDLLADEQRDIAANPERQENERRLRNAQEALQREEQSASRLFIVDAGLDQTALRQRYPDRTHYAIVHGIIRPYVTSDVTSTKLYRAVTTVSCQTINVPLQFRGTVPYEHTHPFNLKVAFGSHLEPWIVSGHAGAT